MNRDYRRWYSPSLHRDMELLVFGHAGAKVLMIPTRDGRFYEYEDLGIVQALAPKVEAGQLQLYCVDSLAKESFYDTRLHPADRIRRHGAFEAYLLHEVMPLMAALNPHDCVIAQGCSLGAFQAAGLFFRHPERFRKLVAFSGRYDLTIEVEHFSNLFSGYYDEDIYFHTPAHFLPNLEGWRLDLLRQRDIVLTIGAEDPFLENNLHFSQLLSRKGIAHQLHLWEGRAHRAGAWRRMAGIYV
ncbi:esterase [Xaviernesmea oryzae]|uniref:Esterase n=1 Tax=Xaviernesmea oryzae TaxID=464029 RepID=A0A1Q9AVE8_9HYPH|nr:esterase family protein [Xaviernesmea oryzae]OLP59432.1 esterase [Xaviernesmea oryzae]SEL60249.1 Esterase/lipase superfamily enzyme [Xaviernesmea oryzae]